MDSNKVLPQVGETDMARSSHDRVSIVSAFPAEERPISILRTQEEHPTHRTCQLPSVEVTDLRDEPNNDNPELLPTVPNKETVKSGNQPHMKDKEWIPLMLRRGPAILLFTTCCIIIILLECLYIEAHKKQGFSANDIATVRAARYCPTIAVILLGFGWKRLVKDLKVITPFAAMFAKWTDSRTSMLLDYIDPLDIVSVWKSARNRHWPLFLALVGGLLCGLLVPFANSLTFVNLSSPIKNNIAVGKVTQFSFNNTLATSNGTLYMPWNYLGQQPYAAVASSRQPNGIIAPYSTNEFAFESFNTSQWSTINASISANAQAFSAPFDCAIINYDIRLIGGDWFLSAKANDLATADCSSSLQLFPHQDPADVMNDMGWLNITDCSQDGSDLRMIATVVHNATTNDPKPLGLMCRPRYYLQQVDIQVNTTTNSTLALSLDMNSSKAIDIGAGLPAIITYLNFPLDPSSQLAYIGVRAAGPSPSFKIPQATFFNVTQYAQNYFGRDPFFNQLLTGTRNASDYIANQTLFVTDVTSLSNTVLTQVVNSFARTVADVPTTASIVVYQSRLLVRERSVRVMQTILGFLGLVSAVCCIMRPRSRLIEDPTSLAATSVLTAQTSDTVRQKLGEVASLDQSFTQGVLRDWRWRMSHQEGTNHIVEGTGASDGHSDVPVRENRKPCSWTDPCWPWSSKHAPKKRIAKSERYQPIAFKISSRVILSFLFLAFIVALTVLLTVSDTRNGFPAPTSTTSAAWSFIPTALLVLLSYALSNIDSNLSRLTPYLSLSQISGARAMLFSPNSSAITMPFRALLVFGSASLAISSFSTLFFPAVSIIAAGLYSPIDSFETDQLQISIDSSLMDHFEDTYQAFPYVDTGNMPTMIETASQFAEWPLIPEFGVPPRPGVLDNLAFANLTTFADQASSIDDQLAVRLPAIFVNVTCEYFGAENFQLFVSDFGSGDYLFSMQCITANCNDTIGGSELINTQLMANMSISGHNYYLGSATLPALGYLGLTSTPDLAYNVVLSNLTSIMVPFINLTSILPGNDVPVTSGMFNFSSLPTMVATSCKKQFWEVEVNATITRRINPNLHNTLPWAVSAYDNQSITYKKQYNDSTPRWAYPVPNTASQYVSGIDGSLASSTLWPSIGKSTNFFELLAAYQQFVAGDLNAMFAPNQLAVAAKAMFAAYDVQLLTELRTFTSAVSNGALQNRTGTITRPVVRIKQDTGATVAIVVILGAMFIGLIYIYVRFPKESVLLKPPTSIAAQMSLFAGSQLVKEFRDKGVRCTKESNVWSEKFRLGWWPGDGHEERRWGIDVIVRPSTPTSLRMSDFLEMYAFWKFTEQITAMHDSAPYVLGAPTAINGEG